MGVVTSTKWQIPRRRFFKGLGTAMALPLFEAMAPGVSLAAAASEARKTPVRMAFFYIPNGANMAGWTPESVGSDFELPYILQPLKPVQQELLVLTGLA